MNLRSLDNTERTAQIEGRLSSFSAPQFRVEDSIFANFAEPLEHNDSPRSIEEDAEVDDAENESAGALP